ncbi:MAG: hypothetical protein AB1758_07230 [Candidatus Eremiobacterota bacterium]
MDALSAINLTDIQERTAKINTFVRFNKVHQALTEAYRLRLDIQSSSLLAGKSAAEARSTLRDLETLVDQLERKKFSGPGYFLKRVVRTFQLMVEGKTEEDRVDL